MKEFTYRVIKHSIKIEKLKVIKETPCTISFISERYTKGCTERKSSDYQTHFDTFEKAKTHLINREKNLQEYYKREKDKHYSYMREIEKMQE